MPAGTGGGLQADLAEITDLVSLGFVADPFGGYDEHLLKQCFPDVAFVFKEALLTDLCRAPETYVSAHHRRNVRKGEQRMTVECVASPISLLDDWTTLYGNLIQRHGMSGVKAFSRAAFAGQLQTPGMVAFRARQAEQTAGALLWYEQGDVAYYHLGAYSKLGYTLNASFALFWRAIAHFQARGLRWLYLGGSAGVQTPSEMDGLSRFKAGWATERCPVWFCGRIFRRAVYAEIVQAKGIDPGERYFPAYRAGEMA